MVPVNSYRPERTVRVGTKMALELRQAMKRLLIEHQDVFAGSHEEMPRIDNMIIEHRLCVDPGVRKVKQKCWNFSAEN